MKKAFIGILIVVAFIVSLIIYIFVTSQFEGKGDSTTVARGKYAIIIWAICIIGYLGYVLFNKLRSK